MTNTPGQPAPNWFPDPADATRERWWSGQGWTDHVRDGAPPADAPPIPQFAMVESPPPATDYAEASPMAVRYVPMGGWAHEGMQSHAFSPGLSARPPSATTVPIWLLAFSLALNGVFGGLTQGLQQTGSIAAVIGLNVVWWGLLIGAILWDRSILAQRGLPTASWLWFFLTVLAYFIARSVALSRVGVRNNSPMVVFCVLFVLAVASAVSVLLILAARTG